MEKLICSACGAPLTPSTNEPFLTCEYCDTTVANKYYVAPAVEKAKEPVQETAADTAEDLTDAFSDETQETSSGGGLVKALLGVGTAITANSMRRRATVVRRTPVAPRTASAPHRHPEPPRTGSFGARPARTTQGGMGHGGMGRPHGGMNRGGGPGRNGGPGGRHR